MKKPPVVVHLHADAASALTTAAAAAHPRETGGVLLGWWDDGRVIVRDAVEVVDPAATSHSWSREHDRAQRALEAALTVRDHPWLGYVGDWHSHPAESGPSGQDRLSIRNASRQYEHPVVLLVHRPNGTVDVAAAHRGRERLASLATGEPEGQQSH